MKKIIYSLMLLVSTIMMSSCGHDFLGDKDDAGGTVLESMAGEWYVTADLADENGNVLAEDCYGIGRFIIATYNTSANKENELFVEDNGNFWDFKVKAAANLATLSFNVDNAANMSYDCGVAIKNGKIIPGGGVQNNGSVADAIEFLISFDDDEPGYWYRISGVRYSGLVEND